MTATPLRKDNRDTYRYFGNPVYTYSLRQGIEDGFLAPYRVHRIVTEWDAAGWRPSQGDLDRYGRSIPDSEYQTVDFERAVALKARTEAIARNITDFMKKTDRFAKTIVFCVDQEHADEMRAALNNLNADLVQQYPDYVCRITSDEGSVGKGLLSKFQELETGNSSDRYHVSIAHHRRRYPHLQEYRDRARGRLDGGIQADHRPRHSGARRLRQVLFQHSRLHRFGDAALCRPGF